MKTFSPTNSMIICVNDTGDYVLKNDIEELITKSSRLAESILMTYDTEEQVRLAKEVACIVHNLLTEE